MSEKFTTVSYGNKVVGKFTQNGDEYPVTLAMIKAPLITGPKRPIDSVVKTEKVQDITGADEKEVLTMRQWVVQSLTSIPPDDMDASNVVENFVRTTTAMIATILKDFMTSNKSRKIEPKDADKFIEFTQNTLTGVSMFNGPYTPIPAKLVIKIAKEHVKGNIDEENARELGKMVGYYMENAIFKPAIQRAEDEKRTKVTVADIQAVEKNIKKVNRML